MTATKFHYNTPAQAPVVDIKTIGSRTYRIGTRAMGGFFVRERETGSRLDFYSRDALDTFLGWLEDAAENIDPTPTPAAPMLRVLPQVTVSALSVKQFINPGMEPSVNKTHVIKINPVRGERFPVDTPVDAAYAAYKRKYGFEATRHYVDATNSLYVTNAKASAA
jgi:hypothetical protein